MIRGAVYPFMSALISQHPLKFTVFFESKTKATNIKTQTKERNETKKKQKQKTKKRQKKKNSNHCVVLHCCKIVVIFWRFDLREYYNSIG